MFVEEARQRISRDDPVDLLAHRAVEGAQARLQVGDRDAQLDRPLRRVDVAGDDHEIGTLLFQHRLDALRHQRRLNRVAGRANAEHVVGGGNAQLFEEHVRHQPVVVLTGVDQRVAAVGHPPALADL